MAKTYVTFGQNHIHQFGELRFDKNCVAEITCSSADEGRDLAFEIFGTKFCMEYHEDVFPFDTMRYYPRGIIAAN